MKPSGYIVVHDDGESLVVPMGWDADCEGAICCGQPIAMFPDIKSARKSIRISTLYSLLCHAQGKPSNTDFTTHAKFIKVVPLVFTRERDAKKKGSR